MSKFVSLLILAACIPAASAQVYESVDDQDNPVFSDQPSAGGQAVELPEPNLGDAVEVPPPPKPTLEAQPEIVPDRGPGEVDGEMIGEKRKKKKKSRPRPTPK